MDEELWKKWLVTENGDEIKPNLMVFTYDWRWGKVDAQEFEYRMRRISDTQNQGFELRSDDFWFKVAYPNGTGNIYNGERMTTRCPNCRRGFEDCDKSGCGQRKELYWTGWNKMPEQQGDEAIIKLEFEGVERDCIPVKLFSFGEPGPEMYVLTCKNHPQAKYLSKNPYLRHLHITRYPNGNEFMGEECDCSFSDLVVVMIDSNSPIEGVDDNK